MLRNQLKRLNGKFLPGNYLFDPEWLVLGVNNLCNLHCKMCDVGTQNTETVFAQNLIGTRPLNMPPELFRRIADQAAAHYPRVRIGYAFTEPLIYPHLEETLAYARERSLFTAITTNGLNLRQKAEMLSTHRLNELFISLDGPEAIHNETRGHKNSFQWALQGIDKVLGTTHPPQISVFCVITEWNAGHLQEFLDSLRDFPLKQVGFLHMNFTPESVAEKHNLLYGETYRATASNMDEVHIEGIDLKALWEEIQTVGRTVQPFPVSFSPKLADFEALERFYLRPDQLIGKQCNDLFTNIMIKSDGSVIPAHGRCYNTELGNLYQSTLPEIWKGKQLAGFRRAVMAAGGLLPACSRCCSAF